MQQFHPKGKAHEYVPFPELGSGGQFHVYDMHDGRVLKLPLTEAETFLVVRQRRNTTGDGEEIADDQARALTFINGKARIPGMLRHNFLQPELFLSLIGKPTLVSLDNILPEDTPEKRWGAGRVAYTQNRLNMTATLFNHLNSLSRLNSGDVKKIHQIIDTYVEHTFSLWEFGYADYVFKLGDTGFDDNGNFAIADLGEFSSDLTFMKAAVQQKRWKNNINPAKTDFPQIPLQAQQYFFETLSHNLTVEELEKRWRTKHVCSDCREEDDVLTSFIRAKVAEIDYVDRW